MKFTVTTSRPEPRALCLAKLNLLNVHSSFRIETSFTIGFVNRARQAAITTTGHKQDLNRDSSLLFFFLLKRLVVRTDQIWIVVTAPLPPAPAPPPFSDQHLRAINADTSPATRPIPPPSAATSLTAPIPNHNNHHRLNRNRNHVLTRWSSQRKETPMMSTTAMLGEDPFHPTPIPWAQSGHLQLSPIIPLWSAGLQYMTPSKLHWSSSLIFIIGVQLRSFTDVIPSNQAQKEQKTRLS